ncbi:MAG: carbohydrate kinase family protein [Pirellulales bacterium]
MAGLLWKGMTMAVVGCAGILVADTFCGPMPRLPKAGELLAVEHLKSSPGGCAANVAICLARQGLCVDVAGCVGRDASADALLQELKSGRVGCDQVVRCADWPTSRTVILLVENEDRRYIHEFGANRAFTTRLIDRNWLNGLKLFYFGGLFATPGIAIDEFAELLTYCRRRGIVTVVDVVVPQSFECREQLSHILPHIDFFLPNSDEACRLTGESDVQHQLNALLAWGARTVVVTGGTNGCTASDGHRIWNCGTFAMRSTDPSGAGDAFAAGVITGALRGWEMDATLKYATALGGSATLSLGTTTSVFDAKQADEFVNLHSLPVCCVPLADASSSTNRATKGVFT